MERSRHRGDVRLESHPRDSARAALLTAAVLLPIGQGCSSDTATPPAPAAIDEPGAGMLVEEQGPDIAPPSEGLPSFPTVEWRRHIESLDPVERRAAVIALPDAPGTDGVEVLRRLALGDPDRAVREQAVFAVAEVAQRESMPFLKHIALSQDAVEVTQAAQVSYAMLKERFPPPQRGWMEVRAPSRYRAGSSFPIEVRFGSSIDVQRARLVVELPEGLEVLSPAGGRWLGAVTANAPSAVEVQVRAHSVADGVGTMRLELVQDVLDAESLARSIAVQAAAEEAFVEVAGTDEEVAR